MKQYCKHIWSQMLHHSTGLQYALLWLASTTNWYILPKLYYLLITFTCNIVYVPSSCFILHAYSSCCDSNWWSLPTLPRKWYENIFLLLLPLAGWLESQSHDGEQVQLLRFSLNYYVYSNATTKLKTINDYFPCYILLLRSLILMKWIILLRSTTYYKLRKGKIFYVLSYPNQISKLHYLQRCNSSIQMTIIPNNLSCIFFFMWQCCMLLRFWQIIIKSELFLL